MYEDNKSIDLRKLFYLLAAALILTGRAKSNDQMVNDKMVNEFGDLLFAMINAARLYKIRPDNALEQTNLKFIKRFNYIEQQAKEKGKDIKDLSLAEMDELWNKAKRIAD